MDNKEITENKVKVYEPLEFVKGSPQKIVPGYYPMLYLVLSLMGQRLKDGGDMSNLKYSFTVNDVGPEFRLKYKSNAYRKLAEITHNVNANPVLFHVPLIDDRGKNALSEFPAYAGVVYSEDGLITITVSPDFNNLAVSWMKRTGFKVFFDRCEVLPMKSDYSMAIFPDLISNITPMSFTAKGNLKGSSFTSIYPVDEFRDRLKIPDSYRTVGIKRICDQIVKDVETYTHYTTAVSYNFTKGHQTTKKLTHICFLTSDKGKAENKSKAEPKQVSKYDVYWLVGLSNGKISEKEAREIMTAAAKYERDRSYVEKCYETSDKDTTSNLVGMMISLLRNGVNKPIHGGSGKALSSDEVDDFLKSIINGTEKTE